MAESFRIRFLFEIHECCLITLLINAHSERIFTIYLKITSKSGTGKTETARLLVLGEVTLQSKLFAASVAAKGLDVAVSLDVSPQVALVRKTLAALVTVVRLLSRVGPDVALEQPGAGEGLATEGALAARGVGPHVHVQGGGAAVLLVTVAALLHVQVRLVSLSVPRQVGAAGVGLAALWAGEAAALDLPDLEV